MGLLLNQPSSGLFWPISLFFFWHQAPFFCPKDLFALWSFRLWEKPPPGNCNRKGPRFGRPRRNRKIGPSWSVTKGLSVAKSDGERSGVRAGDWLAYLESLWLKHYLSLPEVVTKEQTAPFRTLSLEILPVSSSAVHGMCDFTINSVSWIQKWKSPQISCMVPPANSERHVFPIGPVSYSVTSRGFWDTLMISHMPLNSFVYAAGLSSFNSSQMLNKKISQQRYYRRTS